MPVTKWQSLIHQCLRHGDRSVIPQQALNDVCSSYLETTKINDKAKYMTSLAKFGYHNKIENLPPFTGNVFQIPSYRVRLQPNYQPLITACAKTSEGLKFVMTLRQDILDLVRFHNQKIKDEHNNEIQYLESEDLNYIKLLENDLNVALNHWFSAGLSHIQRVTWNSSATLLENVFTAEKVHKIEV